jgi:aspartate kinase
MKTLVMKFGGAAVANIEQFSQIAKIIIAKHAEYSRLVIVVSAMAQTTDQLIALAKQVHPNPPQREYDMLISAGERISMSLLAMALCRENKEAVSFTGSQSGIITCSNHTNAQIIDIRPHRLAECLNQGKIVIVAGFQGVSTQKEITTLGRGGSDTSAVGLGVALGADQIEFYKDVPGVFNLDPKQHPFANVFTTLTYQEALDIVNGGAKILHPRAILLAKKNGLPLHVRSFISSHREKSGTRICDPACQRKTTAVYE